MKKLNLKNLKLEANDMLQRNELKTVFGGYSFTSCYSTCNGPSGNTEYYLTESCAIASTLCGGDLINCHCETVTPG